MMIGLKEFFKYFWNYFKSKGCVARKIVIIFMLIAVVIAIPFSIYCLQEDGFVFALLGFIAIEILAALYAMPIAGFIVGRRLAKFKKEIDRLSYSDLKNKKEYYRDFLQNYSPAVLSYIDDFDVGERDIIATVLNLELKGKVKIQDDRIEIVSDEDASLEYNEKYILRAIKNNSFNPKNMINDFKSVVVSDVNSYGLLCEKKVRRKGILKSLVKGTVIAIMAILLYGCCLYLFEDVLDLDDTFVGILFAIPCFLVFATIFLYPTATISYSFFAYLQTFKETEMYRTDKAEKINENIEGLKNFLKDFSLLAEREREEIELWDRYLIYSVMFGQNKEIVRDFEKYYN